MQLNINNGRQQGFQFTPIRLIKSIYLLPQEGFP